MALKVSTRIPGLDKGALPDVGQVLLFPLASGPGSSLLSLIGRVFRSFLPHISASLDLVFCHIQLLGSCPLSESAALVSIVVPHICLGPPGNLF